MIKKDKKDFWHFMRNKIALKLTMYFVVILVVFSLIIGSVFGILFRRHTIEIKKAELEKRADSIARTLESFEGMDHGERGQGNGYGAYMRFLDDIAMTDVWIIDKNLDVITGLKYSYKISELPKNADEVIRKAFEGESYFNESFSDVLKSPTLTISAPIKNGNKDIIAIVLLHSPIEAENTATLDGIMLLIGSIIIAFFLVIAIARVFSISFTSRENEKIEKLRRDFIANISHELRTPITVIRGSIEALKDGVITDSNMVNEYYENIKSESILLERLVGDLLDLSRLQNTDFNIEKESVSVGDIIDDAVRSARNLAQNKKVSIEVVKESSFNILGDYGRIRQMIMILLDNAIKFSNKDGKVEVILNKDKVIIKDYGKGISKEDLPYIFDRFYKTREENNKNGTGLGLAIAKQIAIRHDLNIHVISEEGKWTEFKIVKG